MMDVRCERCNKGFDSKERLEQHSQAKHKSENSEKKSRSFRISKKLVVLSTIVILIGAFSYWAYSSSTSPGKFDDVAKCLTENNAKFYGAFWCSHCLDQKAMFGKSMKFVNYIECSPPDRRGQTPVCQDAEITTYPTWEFADGSKLTGARQIADLASKAGCSLEE